MPIVSLACPAAVQYWFHNFFQVFRYIATTEENIFPFNLLYIQDVTNQENKSYFHVAKIILFIKDTRNTESGDSCIAKRNNNDFPDNSKTHWVYFKWKSRVSEISFFLQILFDKIIFIFYFVT